MAMTDTPEADAELRAELERGIFDFERRPRPSQVVGGATTTAVCAAARPSSYVSIMSGVSPMVAGTATATS